ncbi:MAG: hypothetical protein U0228_09640 [Myxococcaceae bacterium]
MDAVEAFEAVAGQQLGVALRSQVVARGASRAAVRHAEKRLRLVELHHGVLRRPGPLRDEQQVSAALLVLGEGSAASHDTAAALFKFSGFSLRPIHLSAQRKAVLPKDFVLHRTRPFVTICLGGLRVTTLARTILDCAATKRGAALEVMLDDAHHRFAGVEARLKDELASLKDLRAVPGAYELQRLIDQRNGQASESPEELRFWRLLRQVRLPPFVLQHEIRDGDGGYVMRVDFAWPDHRVAVHFDSYRWHARRVTFDHDATQRSKLNALGWENFVVTTATLDSRQCIEDLSKVLARREPQQRFGW